MNEILFQKNSEKWAETDPKKALMLPYFTPKKTKPQKETLILAEKWFLAKKIKEEDVLFIYGVGNGNSYLAAKKWLQNDRKLIFLEDDLASIYDLFHTDLGSQILNDPKVSLYYFDQLEEIREVTLMLRWEFFMKKIKVVASQVYEKTKKEKFATLSHRIVHDQLLHNALVNEYLDGGASFFKNFYQNLELLPKSYLGSALFGKFKNVPAIICGAGPSLNLHFSKLKELQDHALIFAGGSSLNALAANGITPHFGAGLDPNPAQRMRIEETCYLKLPFFFRSRINNEALKLIEGKRLYIPGSGGYDVSEWFENQLKIDRKTILDEGHNVINFEVEIAHALGCHPIIFVGMDLALTGMRSYADGVIDTPCVTKREILEDKNTLIHDFDSKAILKKDIFGKPIYTYGKWVTESEWMGDFAKNTPKTLLLNATEGGIGFPHVKNITLHEATKEYLKKKYRLQPKISKLIEGAKLNVTPKKIKQLKSELLLSLERSISCLKCLLEEIETIKAKIKALKKIEPNFNVLTGRAALFESDLFEEDSYKYVLAVFNEVFMGIANHEIRDIRLSKMSEKKKVLKKLDLNKLRLTFLKDVAELNAKTLHNEQ